MGGIEIHKFLFSDFVSFSIFLKHIFISHFENFFFKFHLSQNFLSPIFVSQFQFQFSLFQKSL